MSKAAAKGLSILIDPGSRLTKPSGTAGSGDTGIRFNNPIHLDDGVRLSGFTDATQRTFFGYDKNGELLTVGAEHISPARIVSSRDSNRTAEKIKEGLEFNREKIEALRADRGTPAPERPYPLPYVGTGYKTFVEQVSVDELLAMRGNRLGKTDLGKLKAEIEAEGGLREPVIIQVGRDSQTAIVGEGNHRVQAAKELGYTHIPARVLVQKETHGSMPAPKRDDLVPVPGEYFKSDAKPSEVFKGLSVMAVGGVSAEEMALQAQRAVELGATPEEVEQSVAHGTESIRQAVANAVRMDYTGQGERLEFPPAPVRRSPRVAAHTAIVASVFEGHPNNRWHHEQLSEEGIPNELLQAEMEEFQQNYGARDAKDLDLSPEGIEVARAIFKDPGAAFTAAFIEKMMDLETLPEEGSANDLYLRENVEREWPLILRAVYPRTDELEEAKYGLFYNLDFSGKPATYVLPGVEQMGSWAEISTAMALEAIPTKTAYEFFNWSRTAYEHGLITAAEHMAGATFHGNINDRIRRHIASLPAHEQGKWFTEFMQAFVDQFGTAPTPFTIWLYAEGIVPDHFLQTMHPTDRVELIVSNIVGAMVTAETIMAGSIYAAPVSAFLSSVSSAMRGALPGGRALAGTMMKTRPKHYARTMSDLYNHMSAEEFAARWGLEKIDVVKTQMPKGKVQELLDNIPDEIIKTTPGLEPERVEAVLETVSDMVRRQARNVHTTGERVGIVEDMLESTRELHRAAYRPALSRVEVMEDDLGVVFYNTIGKDNATGFSSLPEAVLAGQKHAKFEDLTFFRVNANNQIEPYKPKVKKSSDGVWEAAPGQEGEFFFQYKQTHYFSPFDNAVFGGEPVIAGAALDAAIAGSARWLGAPSSYLHPDLWKKFSKAFLGDKKLADTVDMITAPMFRLRSGELRQVDDIARWAETFGRQAPEGELVPRNPTITELKQAFPDASNRVLGGYYQMRLAYDTIYEMMQNGPLYRAWHSQGFKTLTNGQSQFHGKPLTVDDAVRLARNEDFTVLDASTLETVRLSPEEVKSLMEQRASIIRMELPMSSKGGTSHKHVLGLQGEFRLEELSRYPLKYVPGYYTRMYKDPHTITTSRVGRVDGMPDNVQTVNGIATTRKEADRHAELLMDKEGKKLYPDSWDKNASYGDKQRLLARKGVTIKVQDDARLTAIDKEALDMQRWQSEGRLFYDNRQEKPLTNIYTSEPAEMVNPVNTLHRVARMASRQTSFEELIKQQKNQFFDHFAERLPLVNNYRHSTSKELSDALLGNLRKARGEDLRIASAAYNWWKHIQVFDGTLQGSKPFLRRQLIGAAEFFDYWVGWKLAHKLGMKRIRAFDDIARNAHLFDPIEKWKSLGFLYFITSRMGRQLLLQGGQHFSLQAIDPAYFGRWQMDTFSLLAATKRLGKGLEGKDLDKLRQSALRHQLGYSAEEYDILLREYSRTGLVETVDLHLMAGGKPKADVTIAQTRHGQALKSAAATAKLPIEVMRQYGFDIAEQFNVTASWLLALRRHKKEHGITDLRHMTPDDWDAVATRGSGYSMAMHRANASAWQHGWLGAPLQFVQFSHKWMLTMMGASKTMRKLGLANLNFTREEAAKIVAGQMLLFGSLGIGGLELNEWVRTNLNRQLDQKFGFTLSNEAIDLVAAGVIDYMANETLRWMFEDPDIDLAIGESFAPMGFPYMLRMWGEAAWGNRWLELVGGPGGHAASSLVQAVKMVQALTGGDLEDMDTSEKIEIFFASAASGFLASASDYLKVRMAMKAAEWAGDPQWTHRTGKGTGVEARMVELWAKGLIGVNPRQLLDYYTVTGALQDRERSIRRDASDTADILQRALALGTGTAESYEMFIAGVNASKSKLILLGDNEPDVFTYNEALREEMLNRKVDGKPMIDRAMEIVNVHGDTPDILYFLLQSKLLPPEQIEALREAINHAVEMRSERIRQTIEDLERQGETIKRLRDSTRTER